MDAFVCSNPERLTRVSTLCSLPSAVFRMHACGLARGCSADPFLIEVLSAALAVCGRFRGKYLRLHVRLKEPPHHGRLQSEASQKQHATTATCRNQICVMRVAFAAVRSMLGRPSTIRKSLALSHSFSDLRQHLSIRLVNLDVFWDRTWQALLEGFLPPRVTT